ncbi:MAG TPA: HEAT repeat domain-containing protein [Pyrinomonadaceae bacterium]
MKRVFLLITLLAAFSVAGLSQINQASQTEKSVREFADVADEIKFYLTEAGYYESSGCLVYPDQKQLARVRVLASENKDLFLSMAGNELKNAPVEKTKYVVTVLTYAGTEDNRPLMNLLTPLNLKTVFAQNANAILEQLNYHLKFGHDFTEKLYVIESLVALKHYAAVPEIERQLNEESNPHLGKMMKLLIDLNAGGEIFEFVQTKILNDLCNKRGYSVDYGVKVKTVLETLQALSEEADSVYAASFEKIRRRIVFEPDEASLIKFANQSKSEQLRRDAVLLLAVSKTDAGLKVILKRMKDPSNMVRMAAVQSLMVYPNPKEEAVEALITVYQTDADLYIRHSSIATLGTLGGNRAEEIIREAVNDKSPMIRELAQRIIGNLEKAENR